MRERILKGIIVIGTLITLVMSNLIFVGTNLVYALYEELETQGVNTNNKNVQFDAYFKDEVGNKVHSISRNIKDNGKLYLKVTVKNAGVLNDAVIKLENPNYKLEKVESNQIKSIDTEKKEIYLNSIVYGNSVEIEIPIKFQKEETINLDLFNIENTIKVEGKYKDSDTTEEVVTGEVKTRLMWTEEVNTIVEQSVEKYIETEERKIVQTKITTEIENNVLPKQREMVTTRIPKIEGKEPEEIKVLVNGKKTENYSIDENKEILTINSENQADEENKIIWGTGKDEYKIIYVYGKEISEEEEEKQRNKEGIILNLETAIVTKVYTKEAETKKIEKQEEIREKGNIVSGEITTTEKLYKGYMYAGVENETTYQENMKIEITEAKETNEINIQNTEDNFIDVNNKNRTTNGSIIYKNTKINKQEMLEILGQEGSLIIYKNGTEEIAKINKDTEVNEEGYVVIEYTDTNTIKIVATKPETEGTIEIESEKAIKGNTGYTRNQLKEINRIESKIQIITNNGTEENTQIIELMDTETKAKLQLSKDSLSTVVSNDIEIKAVLVSDDNTKDLYKNPAFRIDLPEEVIKIENLNVNLLYDTELKIKNVMVHDRSIFIELGGEQTTYKYEAVEGANIIIQANIILERTAGSKDQIIRMTYINENSSQSQKVSETGVKIVAPKDVIPVQNISEFSVETIGTETEKKVDIQRGTNKKETEATIEIINNNLETIKNVKVLGNLLQNSKENNLGIKITQGIVLENANVYYTENENATDDINDSNNGWANELTDKSVKYLITINEISSQSSVVAKYKFEIPANLEYNQSAKTSYVVNYENVLSGKTNKAEATVIALETGKGPEAEATLSATIGGEEIKEQNTVKNGEVIAYNVKVTNTGSEDMENIVVSANIPEGTSLVVPEDNYEYSGASYYKELDSKTISSEIKTLKVDESKTITFEVRVNRDTVEGKEISTEAEIIYGDVTKKSNIHNLKVEKGKMRVTVKRTTDRQIQLHTLGTCEYLIIVENLSDIEQEDVKLRLNVQEGINVASLRLNKENLDTEKLEYKDIIDIGNMEPSETKTIACTLAIGRAEILQLSLSAEINIGNEEYKSNSLKDNVDSYKVSVSMTASTDSKYVKSGDIIEYTIKIKNDSNVDIPWVSIEDYIPSQMTVKRLTIDGKEESFTTNHILKGINLLKNTECIIKIEAIIDYSAIRDTAEIITNKAVVQILSVQVAETEEIVHIIEPNKTDDIPVDPDDPDIPDDPDVPVDPDNPDVNVYKMISGMAWIDDNNDGKRDSNEKVFTGMKVSLLNVETKELVKDRDGNLAEAYTDDKGMYILDNIVRGNYIVVFGYDTTKYTVTKYNALGVAEDKNSNAMIKDLTIGNEKQLIASTDIIAVNDQNVSDINIGLIELKTFDLKLDKYVSKIIVQNKQGTTVKEYVNATLVKHEIDAKLVNGTKVIIEYTIKISNVGELEGCANKIVDYIPNDLKFDTQLNKDWYQVGNYLYNESIANEKIAPGDSKTLTLTLTKAMTENNVGAIYNIAEIVEDYNDLGIADVNSTPGNGTSGENDISQADVIISIRTGGIVFTITIIISIIILGVMIYLIVRRKRKID